MNKSEKPKRESPEYMRISLASAMTIKLHPGLFYRNARSNCINLLLTYDKGCYANCSYCGLARERKGEYKKKSFIKVEWDVFHIDEIIEKINTRGKFVKRVCISMITNKRAVEDTKIVSSHLSAEISQPISVLVSPTILDRNDLVDMKKAGVDKIGVAVDLANEELFSRLRGKNVRGPHRWSKYWDTVKLGREIYGPWNIGVHIMIGMGENEYEMVEMFERCLNYEAEIHLFSFFAESDSALSNHPKPQISVYRRMQLANFLLSEGYTKKADLKFDEKCRIVDFGIEQNKLNKYIDSGIPFMTTGCRDRDGKVACNRPYGNCLPGTQIRNFPFKPDKQDLERIKMELKQY